MQRADPGLAPRAGEPRAGGQIGTGADRGGGLILGAVIAGGRSTRFGGDKALALLDGRPLIEHAIAALAPHVAAVVVCGREWPGLVSLPDVPAPGLGPLGGIAAALVHAEATGAAAVLTIGCDMPGVPDALLATLVERRPAWCEDAPVLGCWPVAAAGSLPDLLEAVSGGRGHTSAKSPALSIRRWAQSIGAIAVPAPAPLRNVNTPADLA